MDATLEAAAATLRRGGVIAYPTEAVWGLGCDPRDEAAVTRLFAIKRRPPATGVLLIGASFDHVAPYIGAVGNEALDRAKSGWPGAETWVFPASDKVPAWIRGGHAGIALRVTAHPVAAALCRAFGAALVSTSANRHGEPPLYTADDVRAAFAHEVDAIVEGALGTLARPTPIRDAVTGKTLRS